MRIDELYGNLTNLDRWYGNDLITEAHYRALVAWREDGGGVRKQSAKRKDEPTGDSHAAIAMQRHKRVFRLISQIDDEAAYAIDRLCMLDDPDANGAKVGVGASVVWVEYYGAQAAKDKTELSSHAERVRLRRRKIAALAPEPVCD